MTIQTSILTQNAGKQTTGLPFSYNDVSMNAEATNVALAPENNAMMEELDRGNEDQEQPQEVEIDPDLEDGDDEEIDSSTEDVDVDEFVDNDEDEFEQYLFGDDG
jgi:hypothetical protein